MFSACHKRDEAGTYTTVVVMLWIEAGPLGAAVVDAAVHLVQIVDVTVR